jgi:hypothetical protein
MCAVNRISAEPPSHKECAEFSAKACPFLIQQQVKRRDNDLPEGTRDMPGLAIKRQPGVALLWQTKDYRLIKVGHGVLFKIGDPIETLWFREGRAATRDEVLESIDTGLPILRGAAEKDGGFAPLQLEEQIAKAMTFVPLENPPQKKLLGSAAKR